MTMKPSCLFQPFILQFRASGKDPGADFTKGLKPDFGLKFKTLVLHSSGPRLSGFHKGAKSMDLLSQWT